MRPLVRAQWSICRCMATTAVVQRSGVVTVGCACTGGTSSLRCRWPWEQPFITAVMLGLRRTTLYGARGLPWQGSGGGNRTTRRRPGIPPTAQPELFSLYEARFAHPRAGYRSAQDLVFTPSLSQAPGSRGADVGTVGGSAGIRVVCLSVPAANR